MTKYQLKRNQNIAELKALIAEREQSLKESYSHRGEDRLDKFKRELRRVENQIESVRNLGNQTYEYRGVKYIRESMRAIQCGLCITYVICLKGHNSISHVTKDCVIIQINKIVDNQKS